ncbi:universal stress protein [Desulfofundulus sp. TPOSR]|jgi:nucleotide-binding universal stress UspA family protein|uniref:Universal stress protein n=1 Tax=Desulfofundulus kuznetsovii (strain DSM 6115 / VKM B-1805 / 17) TaxID=760568 RepID=A0AAU8PT50_DESK7|nr:universal stress protein [Desulfofundulus sp. TPOSR]AEG15116.1 UspA domain-containing protein [Desulfofundulus kuznetsovii DSM 6115]NHM28377.1 universal stress protein [Desulfofundulus sp. TPOSR]
MYRKMLVPVDGSHRAALAAEHGAQLAKHFKAHLTIFHVIPPLPPYVNKYEDRLGEVYHNIEKQMEENGKEILNRVKEELAHYGLDLEVKSVWGNPAEEICREAREGRYDIIIMGSRGLGEIRGYLMGSVSNRVVRHAPCPVLIVR